LIEILIVMSLTGFIVLGTSQIFLDSSKVSSVSERNFWLATRRIEMQSLIKSKEGWKKLVESNPSLSCFETPFACKDHTQSHDLVFPISGKVLQGTGGMNNRGDFCDTFDAKSGQSACPIGLKLRWKSVCVDSSCQSAQPRIAVTFQTKVPDQPLKDLYDHELVVFRDPRLESLYEVCKSMGGTLDGITCKIPQMTQSCSPSAGSFALGFDTVGQVICGRPQPGSCAQKDVAVGFSSSGGLQCAPACL
jgi:hypothetical protein